MRARYIARKLGWAALTLFFVLTFNFFLFRIMPGDPVGLLARSQRLTAAEIAEQRARASSGAADAAHSASSSPRRVGGGCGRGRRRGWGAGAEGLEPPVPDEGVFLIRRSRCSERRRRAVAGVARHVVGEAAADAARDVDGSGRGAATPADLSAG